MRGVFRFVAALGTALVVLFGCTTVLDRGELAGEYYNLGTAYFDLGDLTRSADYLSRALELDASLARASYNLARVYILQGRIADAAAILDDLLARDGENVTILETIGYVAYLKDDLPAAAAAYDTVIAIDPGNLNALYNRAVIAGEAGEPEREAELLARARELDENDAGVLDLLASIQEELGDTEGAITTMEELQALGGMTSEALLRLANLYEQTQRYDRALEVLETVIQTADDLSGQAEALFRKGRILLTAADEPAAGVEAIRSALAAGFADRALLVELLAAGPASESSDLEALLSEYGIDTGTTESPPAPDESAAEIREPSGP